jgi:hypothetical protein
MTTLTNVGGLEDLKSHFLSKKKAKTITKLPIIGCLDPKDAIENDQETISLASYVRSGNTLSRGYLEKITGLVTGSDGEMRS